MQLLRDYHQKENPPKAPQDGVTIFFSEGFLSNPFIFHRFPEQRLTRMEALRGSLREYSGATAANSSIIDH
jgi:hypothetical protein